MPARTRPPRRSQSERSAHTRGRILDAALACLAERGFSGTTTTAVAERAGVSRGAQLHHFRTRHELLAAAVQHLYAGLTERYQRGFAQLDPDVDRLRAGLALLWEAYLDPGLTAVLELQVAARTDAALREALLSVAERHAGNIHRLAREYFPDAAVANPRFAAGLDLILDTFGGLRTRALLRPDDPAIPRTLALVEDLARMMLIADDAGARQHA